MHYFVCVLSSFATILKRKREVVAMLLLFDVGLLLSMVCGSSQGAFGWSAVCDCGIC